MPGLMNKEIIFFGGKGGVGKTTCSSAYSLNLARKGYKTLVLSTDPAHSLGQIFQVQMGDEPRKLDANLYGIEIDPEVESKRYINRIRQQMQGSFSVNIIAEIQRQLDAAYHSPGAEEAAIFDRFIEVIDLVGKEYQRIVFDTAPTGHTLRLLSLPELMDRWLQGMIERRRNVNEMMRMASVVDKSLEERIKDDPVMRILLDRKQRFEKAKKFLIDDKRAGFVFVLNPQQLPILETEKAISFLERNGIPVEGVIINRVLPEKTDGEFFKKRKEVEDRYMKQIEEKFGDRILYRIPLMEYDISGYESIDSVARIFG
ncbi:MAG TPA: TRC40/GET3/ArsA family transport-energizing ATPase [Bacillota bacterium]|jgi:arsenite-transporting ATPase|nr:TRC40/GET3/ArsA family transport-energizing ATPase [Bacillota bacterium]HQD41562.1 TRC40/GET3/ArsA family transport-energizing ATPase [Bacillota bacterium]